jgi:hypothetical protein
MRFDYIDQLKFSELSQDYNPIHCNELLARRLFYGQPVVHGVNALIMALSKWSNQSRLPFNIRKLKCRFIKPIFLNKEVDLCIQENGADTDVLLYQDSLLTTNIKFTVSPGEKNFVPSAIIDSKTGLVSSNIDVLKLQNYSNNIDCALDVQKAEDYYGKDFVARVGAGQLAELLSYTRIVGMHAPGMNSIFSDLVISEHDQINSNVSFKVTNLDKRFNLVNLVIDGPSFLGKIQSFYRPKFVNQPPIDVIQKNIKSEEFIGQRALVIGGSRGIGEVTAKYLGCGGSQVLITYSKGLDDAKRVISEISPINSSIKSMHLDIRDISKSIETIIKFDPTHIYYFATPFIFSGSKGRFSNDIYNNFMEFYVHRYKDLVDYLCANGKKRLFFYPSSVAIDEIQHDMMEYTLAKMNGESLNIILEELYKDLKIYTPRLPRMATDQTVSLLAVNNEDPLIILPLLRQFQKLENE